MSFELFQEVALVQDVPEHNLKTGDVATIVEFVNSPDSSDGCVLEVFSAVGETLAVVTVPLSAIESLQADEVRAVRRLAPSS